jgi:hypothetical protein
MLFNIFFDHQQNIMRRITIDSFYYCYLTIPYINDNIYSFCRHFGLEGIFKADSVEWFISSPFSKIPISYIFKDNAITLPKLMLKYGSFKIIDYLIKAGKLSPNMIFDLSKVEKIYNAQLNYLIMITNFASQSGYIYLDFDERQRFLDSSYFSVSCKESEYGSEYTKKMYNMECVKTYRRTKYDDFWVYYIECNKNRIARNKEFMKNNNLEKLVNFLFKANLIKSLIKLDNVMCNSNVQTTWNNFKLHFKTNLIVNSTAGDHNISFDYLMSINIQERSKIVNNYLCDSGLWMNIFKKLTKANFANLVNANDFIWIYENKYFPKRSDLYLLGLAVALDGFNYTMFEKLYYYLLQHQFVSKTEILNTVNAIYSEENEHCDKFKNKILKFLEK